MHEELNPDDHLEIVEMNPGETALPSPVSYHQFRLRSPPVRLHFPVPRVPASSLH